MRFIGNRSSGRMGFAVAEAAGARGSDVVVVAANVALPRASGIRYSDVESAAELAQACEAEFAATDVLVMCAAVADYRLAEPVAGKIARDAAEPPTLRLESTADVVASLAARRREGQTLVGFAAEHGEGALERARQKRERKGLDAIVLNDVSQSGIGFDSEQNAVTIITAAGERRIGPAAKRDVADALLDAVEALRA